MRAALTTTLLLIAFTTPALAQEAAAPPAAEPTAAAPAAQPAPAAPEPPAAPAPAPPPAPASEASPPAAEPATPEPTPAPSQTTSTLIPPPPAGKGQVVFFRPSKLVGAALSFSVHEGDKGIGKLGNGSYFVQVADPGPHTFTIQSEAVDRLTLEIDAGETYYVKQTIGVGVVMGRPHLSPADKAEFEKGKLKLSTKKATDLKPKT